MNAIRKIMLGMTLSFLGIFAVKAQAPQAKVEIEGYCPVAYHVMHKAVKGNPDYASTYQGKTYYFVKGDAKKMFDQSPEKFVPAYDGYCATAMAMGKKVKSDPTIFTEYKGKTYLFSNKMAKEKFDNNKEMMVEKANKAFAKMQ